MKRREQSDLTIGALSHVGEARTNNEDNFAVVVYEPFAGVKTPITLALVADGIGGHQAGEVASGIAVDIIPRTFDEANKLDYRSLFAQAFAATSAAIEEHSKANPASEGLGTTCVAVLTFDRSLYTAAIGDSRIYLVRGGVMRQISIDHSWVQEAKEQGILTEAEARNHPRRNVLRRYLGAGADATPDFRLRLSDSETDEQSATNQGHRLQAGDRLLLCSDGLSDLVSDEEIAATLLAEPDVQGAVERLVQQAREAGGADNITAIVLESGAAPRSGLRRSFNWLVLLIAGVIVIGVAALAAAVLFGRFGM